MNFVAILEDGSWFLLTVLIALVALFIFINVRRTLKQAEQRRRLPPSSNPPNSMTIFALKTILFSLFYGFGIVSIAVGNKISLHGIVDSFTSMYCREMLNATGQQCDKYAAALSVIGQSVLILDMETVAWNVLNTLYLFVCYFYFNIQLGFATLIALFASGYLSGSGYNFFTAFALVSCAVAVATVFYKIKKRLLDAIRNAFSKLGRAGVIKIVEFYIICLPYFVFSLALSALNVSYFNILLHLALIHVLAYSTLYRLYREGCDIGFDYDPW